MAENLILYFSHAGQNYTATGIVNLEKGNTERVAEFIQKAVGGDLRKIEPAEEYPSDYFECVKVAKDRVMAMLRPEIKNPVTDISGYDNIFLCGPVWCGAFPMEVYTQTDMLDFHGKKVMIVTTHEGSGLGNCVRSMIEELSGAEFGDPLAIRGTDAEKSEKKVAEWAEKQVGQSR